MNQDSEEIATKKKTKVSMKRKKFKETVWQSEHIPIKQKQDKQEKEES